MIKIDDSIIDHLDSLTLSEYRTLIILSRYLTECNIIPAERLAKFWGDSVQAMNTSIFILAGTIGWQIERTQGQWKIIDTHMNRALTVEFRDSTLNHTSSANNPIQSTVLPPLGGNNYRLNGGSGEVEGGRVESSGGLTTSLEDLIREHQVALAGSMTNVVNYFLSKKRAIDSLLVIDKRERGKNFGNAKYLFIKYPSIDEATWIKAIDFFFNDPFWAQHFTSLIFLDKHLQKFLISKPRRQSKLKVVS